jgi:hypothetical protein
VPADPFRLTPRPRAEREAILPDPANGHELVERVAAPQVVQVLPWEQKTAEPTPLRVWHRQRPAPNFALPVATGV